MYFSHNSRVFVLSFCVFLVIIRNAEYIVFCMWLFMVHIRNSTSLYWNSSFLSKIAFVPLQGLSIVFMNAYTVLSVFGFVSLWGYSWWVIWYSIFLGFWALLYVLALVWMRRLWFREANGGSVAILPEALPTVSVVIVARNESANLPALFEDLAQQQYPVEQLEVWLIDDYSEDHTAALVCQYQELMPYTLHYRLLQGEATLSPKKRGIAQAVSQAAGEWIACTDGDCRVPPAWLSTMLSIGQSRQAHFVSGGVAFILERPLFRRLQALEFATLVGVGAIGVMGGFPQMCNGANLSFRRQSFESVDGYTGWQHIASGDDEFLMHKMAKAYPKGICFAQHPAAVVQTYAQATWHSFFQQRKRWASKWPHYQNPVPKILAFFIFIGHAMAVLALILSVMQQYPWKLLIGIWGLKCLAEFWWLMPILRFLRLQPLAGYIPLLQIIYPFYVSLFGFVAGKGKYQWKGRAWQ